MEIKASGFFRVARYADFEVSDEADDLLEARQTELHRRRFADVVRLQVWESMSEMMLAQVEEELGINDDRVYPVRGLIDMSLLTKIADLDRPELKLDRGAGVTRRRFTAPGAGRCSSDCGGPTRSCRSRTTRSPRT